MAKADAHRWHAGLDMLGPTIEAEARHKAGAWAWRELRGGALVACRLDEATGRRTIRIARGQAPAFTDRERWAQELRTFERYLGLADWGKTEHGTPAGGVEAIYTEPEPTLFQPGAP